MSKIGAYNLELQEQANELGFETTQEALDAGYTVGGDCDQPVLIEPLVAAHRAWEAEKKKVLEGLKSVYNDIDVPVDDKVSIKNAIKFVEEAHE